MRKVKYYIQDTYKGLKTYTHSLIFRKPFKKYLSSKDKTKPDIIVIQGLMQKWNIFRYVANELVRQGYNVHAVTDIKRNTASIASVAGIVNDYIETNNLNNIIILGHSKGGLIGKYLLVRSNRNNIIKKVFAICTPFNGSLHAKKLPITMHKELIPGSEILLELDKHAEVNGKIISIYGKYDTLITPLSSCKLTGAKNIQADFYGHHGALFSSQVRQVILGELKD